MRRRRKRTRGEENEEEGMANGTSKILGLVNFSCNFEISTAFVKSLKVSFVVHLFQSRSLTCLVSVSDFQTRVSASQRVPDFTIQHSWKRRRRRLKLMSRET